MKEPSPFFSKTSWNRVITFAGVEWQVKSGIGAPGGNKWSDSERSVWVDSAGLHLKIRRVGLTWYSAEIRTAKPTRHGVHRLYVVGRIDSIDRNVVFSPFLYADDNREIDMEFSRWGDTSNPNVQHVLQPPPYVQGDNIARFSFNLKGTHSTHSIDWTSSLVTFESIHGHHPEPSDPNLLIRKFSFAGDHIPSEKEMLHMHINLWLIDGQPPSDNKELEIVIADVDLPSL